MIFQKIKRENSLKSRFVSFYDSFLPKKAILIFFIVKNSKWLDLDFTFSESFKNYNLCFSINSRSSSL